MIFIKTPVSMQFKDGKKRQVLMISYGFDLVTDLEDQAASLPRGGKIHVRVKALNSGSPDLFDWMVTPSAAKDVEFIFMDTVTGKQMKTIQAKGAYCVDYHEYWADRQGHYEEIVLSCREIKFGEVKFTNHWV